MMMGCLLSKLRVPNSAAEVGDLSAAAKTEQHPLEVSVEDTEFLGEGKLLAEIYHRRDPRAG